MATCHVKRARSPGAATTSADILLEQDDTQHDANCSSSSETDSDDDVDDEALIGIVRLSTMTTSELLEMGKSLLQIAETLPAAMVAYIY